MQLLTAVTPQSEEFPYLEHNTKLLAANGTSLRLCKLARPLSFAGLACDFVLCFQSFEALLRGFSRHPRNTLCACLHIAIRSFAKSVKVGLKHAQTLVATGWLANPWHPGSSHIRPDLMLSSTSRRGTLFLYIAFSGAALEDLRARCFSARTPARVRETSACSLQDAAELKL